MWKIIIIYVYVAVFAVWDIMERIAYEHVYGENKEEKLKKELKHHLRRIVFWPYYLVKFLWDWSIERLKGQGGEKWQS